MYCDGHCKSSFHGTVCNLKNMNAPRSHDHYYGTPTHMLTTVLQARAAAQLAHPKGDAQTVKTAIACRLHREAVPHHLPGLWQPERACFLPLFTKAAGWQLYWHKIFVLKFFGIQIPCVLMIAMASLRYTVGGAPTPQGVACCTEAVQDRNQKLSYSKIALLQFLVYRLAAQGGLTAPWGGPPGRSPHLQPSAH